MKKSNILVLFFAIFLAPIYADKCKNLQDGTKLPNEKDCKKYIVCLGGKEKSASCPKNLYYDHILEYCDVKDKVECYDYKSTTVTSTQASTTTESPTTTKEPEEELDESYCLHVLAGLKNHPTKCYKFVHCLHQKPIVVLCPEGYIFCPCLKQCVPGNQDTCSSLFRCNEIADVDMEITVLCKDKFHGVFGHPKVCYKYVICQFGRPDVKDCPERYIFSDDLSTCLPGDRDKCTLYLYDILQTLLHFA